MPAKDGAEFGDGTHSSLPPVTFGDALTGSLNDADDHDDFTMTRVASPVKPDPAAIRKLVEAAEQADAEGPQLDTTPSSSSANAVPPAPPLGMLPRQRARPSLPSFRRPQLRLPRPQVGEIRRVRPSSGSTAIIVAALLVIVYAIVAIEFLSSLITSISGLFN